MEPYQLVKTLHIISAMVLFGTGLGIAFFFWMGGRSGGDHAALFAARATVVADFLFTLTAVVAQPLTGAWLVVESGLDPNSRWLVLTYGLYLVVCVCWVPVIFIQIRVRDMLERKLAGGPFDPHAYRRLRLWWFFLGWPAFAALIAIVHLMVVKPS